MSENLDLVRSIHVAHERGDYSEVEWAHPEIEYVWADGLSAGSWTGLAGMAEGWRDYLSTWEELRTVVEEYRELDEERVVVLYAFRGRGKASGLEVGQMRGRGAGLFHVRDGKVVRLVLYWGRDRDHAQLPAHLEDPAHGRAYFPPHRNKRWWHCRAGCAQTAILMAVKPSTSCSARQW